MNMLSCHAKEIDATSVAYHNFLLKYKEYKKTVYGFVEGKEDPMFYKGIIENKIPQEWDVEFIVAGNRDKVILAMAQFDWTVYSQKRVCFFIDKDLSEFLEEKLPSGENVYITDGYSIENSICTFGFFKRVLQEILNITDINDDEMGVIERLYKTNTYSFKQKIMPLMVQIIFWRKNGNGPCLNNIDVLKYFCFKDGIFSDNEDYHDTNRCLEHAAKCVKLQNTKYENLSSIEQNFLTKKGPDMFIRGKYVFTFMVAMALELHRALPKILTRYKNPPGVRVTFANANAMVVAGSKGRCPDSLTDFISKTYQQYIG